MGEVRYTAQADDKETATAAQKAMCEALGLEPGLVTTAGGERWMAFAHPVRDRQRIDSVEA